MISKILDFFVAERNISARKFASLNQLFFSVA